VFARTLEISSEINLADTNKQRGGCPQWNRQLFQLRFELSYFRLFVINLDVLARNGWLDYPDRISESPSVPNSETALGGAQGFAIYSLPINADLPTRATRGNYLMYVERTYPRYLTVLSGTFEEYQEKFSAKTRSTLKRKIKKFEAHCGGLHWRQFSGEAEIDIFFEHARVVSMKTYQEKLLENGLPSSPDFVAITKVRARHDELRAFVLYHAEKPIAYLYCPVENGSLLYNYLGYDPDYTSLSPGTVLQWLALESIFSENKFRYFDFTEGEGEHKKLFGTTFQSCATVLFLKNTPLNRLLLFGHVNTTRFSTVVGQWADRFELRPRIKKMLRLRK
jgi:CelD/BcsL family acetyltransferase involved in cellulose biosynthesis